MVSVPVAATGNQAATIANTTPSEIRICPQGTTNRNDVAQLNVAWDAIPDRLSVKFGPDDKKFTFDTYEFRRVNRGDTIFAPPSGASVASLTTTINGCGRGSSLPGGTPTSWMIPNLNAISQARIIYCDCIISGPAGGPGDFTLSSITSGNARGNQQSVTETDTGGWLVADFNDTLFGRPVRGTSARAVSGRRCLRPATRPAVAYSGDRRPQVQRFVAVGQPGL